MRTRRLTYQQVAVIAAFASGFNGETIANTLYLSIYTIRNHIKAAKKKVDAQNINQLVAWCVHDGRIVVNEDGTASPVRSEFLSHVAQ